MSSTHTSTTGIESGYSGVPDICTLPAELEADGKRLVLDLGLPLDADFADEVPLPGVRGLDGCDPDLVGVVISHGHPDHWGLAERIDRRVPIYMGETTCRILREARFFTPLGADFEPAGFLRDGSLMQLGPFRVTPYLVDHSAFDAYAVLVEAGGKRLFYSGDFRAHGRRAELFERLIADPPSNIDVLLLEGTHVHDRPASCSPVFLTERDVEIRCVELFAQTEGMVLAAYSPQNVDRMISLYRAARASGRRFVIDLYAATIAAAVDDPDVPRVDCDDVLVYVPQSQRVKVKRSREFDRVDALRSSRIFPDELASTADRLVMTFRPSMARELERARCLAGATALWLMWAGYLDDEAGVEFRHWLTSRNIALQLVHASGHASVRGLQRVSRAVSARFVVPIHTSAPHRFETIFDNTVRLRDGQWWVP